MKADASKFIASCFLHSKNRFGFAYLGPFQILKIAGPVFEPHMHPGNYFWDIKKIADDKLQVVSFHNHLVAGYDIEN